MRTILVSIACMYYYSMNLEPLDFWLYLAVGLVWALAVIVSFVSDAYRAHMFLFDYKDRFDPRNKRKK